MGHSSPIAAATTGAKASTWGHRSDDVAWLERRVAGEPAEDDLAQHLDLPGAPVAGVDLHAAVAPLQDVLAPGGVSVHRSCWRRRSSDVSARLPRLDRPGVLRTGSCHGAVEQLVGVRELHLGADAVALPADSEPVRQPLGEPPFDAERGHGDDVGRQGVVERGREQVAERLEQR
jgi:hypothetical protein